MMTKLTEEQLATISSNNGLSRYLQSLLEGKKFTPRSWLYDGYAGPKMEPDQVLAKWKTILSSLEKGSAFEKEVFQFDTSSEAKWGPQGGVKPISEIMDEIVLPTFGTSSVPKAFGTSEWDQAKKAVHKQLDAHHIYGLRPASYSRVLDDMRARDTLESNSGWPLFTRRNKPEVKQQAVEAAEDGRWKTYPAIALFRNYNQKTRLVWMFPMATNLVEGAFFQPLQSAIMNSDLSNTMFSPWKGFEQVRNLITAKYEAGECIAASDFSSTDAHFHRASSMEVCDVIELCFAPKFRAALRESLEYMHQIPLIVGPNEMITGEHGVSSGSNWTNFIETIFDWILAEYVRIKTAGKHEGLYAIGDDMSWISSRYDDAFADTLEQFGKDVGQEIKAEKTTNEPDKVKSLQRLFQRGYNRPDGSTRGVYPTIRALKSSVYPERFHRSKDWSKDMFCARQFMILENCVDHPLFEEFVKFVCAGSNYLVPFAKQSDQQLQRIQREAKLLPGLNPTYNQEKRDSSLSQFESIRIAREL